MLSLRAAAATAVALLLVGCVERPAADAGGEEIYLELCARCHAPDLSGGVGPALGSGSLSESQPDEWIVRAVVEGRGRMPSFARTLSAEQIARVTEHIRAVQAAG